MGQGQTQPPGGPHAEIVALREAARLGVSVRGATAHVTLEPCAHHGRTPPCCDALIQAGLARVVVGNIDPNPLVSGQGIARMRAAGIDVQLAGQFTGEFARHYAQAHPDDPQGLRWAAEARELNIGFFSRMVRQRPWVRMKIAASLDGQTALSNGVSQWITSPEARADGHAWRRRAGAVLTGMGTVRDDNPRLDVRLVPCERQPLRVVVDSRLEIPPDARLLDPPGSALIYCAAAQASSDKARALTRLTVVDAERAARQAQPRLEIAGPVEGVEVAGLATDERGKTDLAALMADLAQRQVNELHVEAGHQLNASLLKADLVDELLIYLAPKLLGQGLGMTALGPFSDLAQAMNFEFVEVEHIGPDLRLRLRPPGRDRF